MPKAIEKALSDLCNEHALIGLSVEYSAICSDGNNFSSTAYWSDGSTKCAIAFGADASLAVGNAISRMHERRAEAVAVNDLEIGGDNGQD